MDHSDDAIVGLIDILKRQEAELKREREQVARAFIATTQPSATDKKYARECRQRSIRTNIAHRIVKTALDQAQAALETEQTDYCWECGASLKDLKIQWHNPAYEVRVRRRGARYEHIEQSKETEPRRVEMYCSYCNSRLTANQEAQLEEQLQ